jgi:hypothetical protein
MPFGKYKGRPVVELLEEAPKYLQYMATRPWVRENFPAIYQIIIDRGPKPEDTPEHNRIQAMFLDESFRRRFCQLVGHAYTDRVDFEQAGADVVLDHVPLGGLRIEIKPFVGDDYPSVLRQMRHQRTSVLLLEKYDGTSVTCDEFVAMFARSGRKVIFLNEVTSKRCAICDRDFNDEDGGDVCRSCQQHCLVFGDDDTEIYGEICSNVEIP